MDFPHLNDTRFPNLDNVDVYAHQVVFDYKRWQPNTKVYLCNVRWNSDYEDCVKFENDAARDDWFDELVTKTVTENPDCAVTFEFATNVVQGQVKVPVPYDRATQFNYLVVDIPVMTSDDNLLPYETKDGNRRWHFFVEGFEATSPSTTRLNISLDYWTQYINSVGFNYFLLERGHAPVSATDTDTYLANPMENNELLLTPDIDFGGETISKHSEFIPFGNGEKVLCFASTCTPAQFSKIGTVTTDSSATFSDPVFSDETAYPDNTNRWGYRYHVENYGYGSGKSYSNVTTPAGNVVSADGRVPSNVTVYAIAATSAAGFLSAVQEKSPSFLKTIVACFMVAKELVTYGTSHSIAGYTVYECTGNESNVKDLKLTKSMFDIPERYQKFAKLYTFPYSELEVTDNDGKTVRVRIEETGSISAHTITSIAFPYLNMRMFLTGIGGKGSNSYKWQDLRGSHDAEVSGSDWYRFCFDMNIPTYALYMDGQTSWELNNYNRSLSNARNSALVNYHNSVRQANNVCNNARDSADTNKDNTRASAAVSYNNTVKTSNVNHVNTNNDASTLDTNNANSRACASDNTATNNAANTANTSEMNSYDARDVSLEYARSGYQVANAEIQSTTVTAAENESTTATAAANSSSGFKQAQVNAVGGAVTAGSMVAVGGMVGTAVAPGIGTVAGAAIGGAVGAVTGIANSLIAGDSQTTAASAVVQANTASTDAINNGNTANREDNHTVNTQQHESKATYNTNTNTNSCNAATSVTNRNNDCNKANTDNTTATMRTNATNIDNNNVTCAGDYRDTMYSNADRLRDTATNNAVYTAQAAIAAAQDILRNTQNEAKATFNDSRNAAPVKLCDYSGTPAADYNRTRGIQIKVRTQSKNSIACAGDEFTRYGYRLNQIWQVSDLRLMKHFTYWKAKDCWVYDICETSDLAQSVIASIFMQGVTVWSNPNEIGKVNPYDN